MRSTMYLALALVVGGLAWAQEEREDRKRGDQDRVGRGEEGGKPRIDWEAKYREFLRENPGVARGIEARNFAKENILYLLRQGEAKRALKAALKVMRDADKLTDTQVDELFRIVFPKEIDWEAKYESFLKKNPGVAKAVRSGKISKESVITGIKSREGERPPTEEEQLEALYQKLVKDEPTLGRTPKAELMPRLKSMLERGEGKSLRPEKTTRQRMMTFGLYFNGLIESGQVERFDKDLKRVHDVGSAEIQRQGRQGGKSREPVDPHRGERRGGDRELRRGERTEDARRVRPGNVRRS